MGDAEGYCPSGEVAELRTRDPLITYRQRLVEACNSVTVLESIEGVELRVVTDALAFARNSNFPAAETAFEAVFS